MNVRDPEPLPRSALLPSARARGIAALLAVAGTLIATSPVALGLVWVGALVPLMWASGVLRHHARFLGVVLGPIAVVSVLVWGVLVGAPPGMAAGTAPVLGLRYAATTVARLAMLGALMQATVLSLSADELPSTLRSWGVRGDGLAITLGCIAMAPELRLRAEQVVTARYARGLIRTRGPFARIGQLRHVLVPLFAWTLRAAIQRSDAWRDRGILSFVYAGDGGVPWRVVDLVYVGASAAWVVYSWAGRWASGG